MKIGTLTRGWAGSFGLGTGLLSVAYSEYWEFWLAGAVLCFAWCASISVKNTLARPKHMFPTALDLFWIIGPASLLAVGIAVFTVRATKPAPPGTTPVVAVPTASIQKPDPLLRDAIIEWKGNDISFTATATRNVQNIPLRLDVWNLSDTGFDLGISKEYVVHALSGPPTQVRLDNIPDTVKETRIGLPLATVARENHHTIFQWGKPPYNPPKGWKVGVDKASYRGCVVLFVPGQEEERHCFFVVAKEGGPVIIGPSAMPRLGRD